MLGCISRRKQVLRIVMYHFRLPFLFVGMLIYFIFTNTIFSLKY